MKPRIRPAIRELLLRAWCERVSTRTYRQSRSVPPYSGGESSRATPPSRGIARKEGSMRPYRAWFPLWAILLATLTLGCYAAGCSPSPAPTPSRTSSQSPTSTPSPTPSPGPTSSATAQPPLSIWNGTTLQITLIVNGQPMRTIQPGDRQDPVDRTGFPAPPWHVEARTATGRVLAEMDVVPEDIWCTTPGPDGHWGCRSAGDRADLSCGRLDLWAGMPMHGPMPPSSFPPGDCDP